MRSIKLLRTISALFGLTALPAAANTDVNWPDLPTRGFLVGRSATLDDAKQGNAVFSMGGKSLGALPVTIPQYVWWRDEKGQKHPMILVQAESAPNGTQIAGLRDFAGQETVATMPELELLGTKKPN